MFTSVRKSDFNPVGSINYEIGQKVESCRLIQGYNQRELASKIGSTYQEINNYELGYSHIPIEELYRIAGALSVSIIDLLPGPTELKEDSWYEDEDEEIVYLTKIHIEIKDQELRKKLYPLVRFVYVSEKISQEEARIEVAKNLVKEGVSVDIISQATRLSNYEYDDTEKEICTDSVLYKVGKRIKEQRLIWRYTREELANKVGSTSKEIHDYEQGYTDIPIEILDEIAKALSVNIKALFLEPTEYENELLRFIGGYKEIEDQGSRDVLDALVKSLSEGMQTGKEKVKKAEKIRVAKDLVKAGIAVDIILRASGLTVSECPKMN
ncbi:MULTISPECIES: WO male-killing family protein Wmk [Wolbachia]|uniref:WO male-killing family protein Wmk n=1 Tax=Wolbachia TaxID=953 RepID=UPI0012505E44|nr:MULTISPECIES: helix-turn-helix domain-containing protein [Wolbachia]KAB2978037.1 helix-turn-helix domain-containing protein [Wolbachia endosymbiont of Nasonia oneida]MBA8754158.1 helix-turn-helix domain-containing protein [Wolbachia pipientis]MDU8921563.1 helix-turn-helix domain-containing protein [Wolbachia endosymbiont of Scaptomyza pallida]